MIVIEIAFLAGRFHATPWGRHVNEGVPEWPPAPYRLVRALYDTWRRKRPDWSEDRVRRCLEGLATNPPCFRLPPAAASHTRSYLSSNQRDETDKQLIFDAFVVVEKDSRVLIGWPALSLSEEARQDLGELLGLVNYLGRSESWVTARLLPADREPEWNCVPATVGIAAVHTQPVPVACPVAPTEYGNHRYQAPAASRKRKSAALSWLDAIAWSSGDVQKARLSDPPAMAQVTYRRPTNCFEVSPVIRNRPAERIVHAVKYAVVSKVPAPVTATIEVAERLRAKLMGIHRRLVGHPAKVSPHFSGKDLHGTPLRDHRHVFILPVDEDSDGWLDHILVACREPLDSLECAALDRADSLWQRDGRPDLMLVPLSWGTLEDVFPPATCFRSLTPFVPPRHYRRGRGDYADWLAAEVRREATNHGFPEPVRIGVLPDLATRRHRYRWLDFRSTRKDDPHRVGTGFELGFAEPVIGPVALGYGCHFGMGLFLPERRE
jgi:CRISPR-associated protein Csb2